MDIRIRTVRFDADERLQDFIISRVGKLGGFGNEIGKVEVSLEVVKSETAENKRADLRAEVMDRNYLASETCDTFEEAVDKTCEMLACQMEKHKKERI